MLNAKDGTIALSVDGHADDDPVKSDKSYLSVTKMYSDQEKELRTEVDRLSDMDYMPERQMLEYSDTEEPETKSNQSNSVPKRSRQHTGTEKEKKTCISCEIQ